MKRGLFIGRFQPFHLGHLSVLKEMEQNPDIEEIIIGIGSSQYHNTLVNPFTAEERKLMIQASLKLSKPVRIIFIPDIHNDPMWVSHVKSLVPPFNVVYTGNKWVKDLFELQGYPVITPQMEGYISGTVIREKIIKGEDYNLCLPKGTQEVLLKINGLARLKEIAQTQKKSPNPAVDLSKILIARKRSILEYDMQKYHRSEAEMLQRYQKMGMDIEKIKESHEKQLQSLKEIQKALPLATVVVGEFLTKKIVRKYQAVVSLGGDNLFLYAASFLINKPIIGINSDPSRSEGAILNFTPKNFSQLVPKLAQGTYKIEPWVRLKTTVNSKTLPCLAVGEVFIGAKERLITSRYSLEFDGKEEEHKDSGLLIATGTGSTGWYRSAASCCHQKAAKFSKSTPEARFISTETYYGSLTGRKLAQGTILPGQKIKITWFAHGKGVVSLDYSPQGRLHYLNRGAQVTVEIADQPLLVIT